jgi:hypothetical protein
MTDSSSQHTSRLTKELLSADTPAERRACPACGELAPLGHRTVLGDHDSGGDLCPASGESYAALCRLARRIGPARWAVRWESGTVNCDNEGEARRRAGIIGRVINYAVLDHLLDRDKAA